MGSSLAVGAPARQPSLDLQDEPSPVSSFHPHSTKLPLPSRTVADHKTTLHDSSRHGRDGHCDDPRRPRERFVRGRWETELNDWQRHCIPNGWMVCCLPCVSVAQISVRIGVDSYGAALTKQVVFNLLVWGLVVLELVYCYRYMSSVFGGGTQRTATPPIVIFSACFTVAAISFVWVRSLAALRARVRERFRIDGSASDDKCAMAWCTPCALAQMATQVKSYAPGSCDVRARDALPAYIP